MASLNDLSELVNSGKVKKIGQSTLQKDGEVGTVYRGNGLTLVVRQDGSYWTLLENSGTGLDKVIDQYLKPIGQ